MALFGPSKTEEAVFRKADRLLRVAEDQATRPGRVSYEEAIAQAYRLGQAHGLAESLSPDDFDTDFVMGATSRLMRELRARKVEANPSCGCNPKRKKNPSKRDAKKVISSYLKGL